MKTVGGITKFHHPFLGGITKTKVPNMEGPQNKILGYHKIGLLASMIYKMFAATVPIIQFITPHVSETCRV